MPTDWHKSSYSPQGDNCCLEQRWQKASYSGGGNDCVEARLAGTRVTAFAEVRDTKDRKGGSIAVAAPAWKAFLAQVA